MDLESLVITKESLGEGGFGTVFVGRLDEMKVAAKRLSQSEEEFNNLTREASKLERLRHGKHITHIHGIALEDKDLYMVMEYSEQGDLQNYLQRNKESVTYEQKILFCRGILLGLFYCHSMNIFHGDIKCSNVILGKNLEPKLTDFGLSMTVDNVEYYSKLYNGSLYWAAPELFSIKDNETVHQEFITDPYPCDVYSLGATFCEISYNGTTEFIDSNEPDMDIVLGIVSPTPKDAFLEEVVNHCCQFNRNERISLESCFNMLETVTEEQLSDPVNQSGFDFLQTTENEWKQIQKQIKAKPTQALPPSFILHRPTKNLVVGLSNLSLLEWLCVNDCVDAVKYMVKLHNPDQKQFQWLYSISDLCRSSTTARLFRRKAHDHISSDLSKLMDSNPQQFIEVLIRAGANCEHNLLHKILEKHYNQIVQAFVDLNHSSSGLALHDAIDLNNLKAVKILAAGARLETRDINGDTPLLTAINTGDVEIVKILLDLGADVHKKNNRSQYTSRIGGQHTPLVRAAAKGSNEIVEVLINAGATIDIEDSEWHSLVQDLEQEGNSSIVQLINNAVRKGTKVVERNHDKIILISNSRDKNKKSTKAAPLYTAIRNGQSDLVQKLIDDGTDVNEQDCDGYSFLHWAVIIDDEKVVKVLLTAGSDIDVKTPNAERSQCSSSSSNCFNECTPLHIVIIKRHLGIAKLLIESGADFSAKNGSDQTITDIANEEDQKEIEFIIRNNAPVGIKSLQRAVKLMSTEIMGAITIETVKAIVNRQQADTDILSGCLDTAVNCGNLKAVNYFIECGADVNKRYNGWSSLELALFDGHVQIARVLIDAGANVNEKNEKGRTLLYWCVSESNTKMVQFLVEKGADVNARDTWEYTPVYYAKSRKIVKILINTGADINVINWYKESPLHQSVKESNAEVVQFLVDKGANINFRNIRGIAPICYAKSAKIVQILINAGADINAKNGDGESLLHQYVRVSNTQMVQFLVDKGANANVEDIRGNTPIYYAENKEVVQILINGGANVNTENQYGESSLHQSVKESNAEVVQFLVDKGANINFRNIRGIAPICYAKSAKIVQILTNAGADINAKNGDGESLLHQYVRVSNTEFVQFLVDKGANANVEDIRGNTPIYYAENKEVVQILINGGANVNTENQYRESPLHQSVKESNAEVVQFLVDKGANINFRNIRGIAPICYAKSAKIVQILINAGADINAINQYGKLLLHQFVIELNTEIVQLLVEKGADVNARDIRGNASIHSVKSKEIAEILVNAGADTNIKDNEGNTLLDILLKEQNINLGNTKYQRKENCKILEYLRKLKK